ncbi:MAG: ORF6N domain-containing protein [Prevotellaceae bacterium]|jgi:hypothetical protein|nr:ORF6N domain-containing protein [Prevotellaceae bacterium]
MQVQTIESKIYEIRGEKVMLDFDLATMYEVETRTLKQAVKRNLERFSPDFMFQLSKNEWLELITDCDKFSETVKHNPGTPSVFTEQGIAMLSSVLRSKRAIQVNIVIMRAFVFMRQYALTHKDLTEKLKDLEEKYDQKFLSFEQAINYLLNKDKIETEQKERKRTGFGN